LCDPTPAYELTQGQLTDLPVITEAEREMLLEAAWSLNEYRPEPVNGPTTPVEPTGGLRPGDDFSRRGDARAILRKHGWTLARSGENEYWRRPGKDHGWSATLKDGVFYVHSTNAPPFEGQHAYGPFAVYTLLEHRGDYSAAASALRTEGYGDDGPVGEIFCTEREWPEPLPLDDPQPPPMPSRLLPGWLGMMAECIAEATETPMEMPGLLCLAAVATAAQGRFSVRPEAGYFEPVNIWAAPGMKSGQRKSAVQKLATAPLLDWEREQGRAVAEQYKAVESQLRTVEARVTKLRARCANEDDPAERDRLQLELEELEASMPVLPVAPRLFTQDVTPEHLGTMLATHNERMAVLSDEGGIFDILAGRYSSGALNLDLFLQAHSGSPVRVDRGSRPSVLLNHPLLTIGLSPQPDVLRSLNNKPGFRGRGLLARFLYALPQSKMGYRDLEPREVPPQVADRYAAGLRALLATPQHYDNSRDEYFPHTLMFDHNAYEAWKAHQRRVEVELRDTGRFAHMTDWGGKLPGATARVSALMHCAQWALEPGNPVDHPIAEDTVSRAVQLGELLAEHALAVFELMADGGELEAARIVWKFILAKELTAFNFSEVWHPLRGTFKKSEAIEPALEVLLDHNLILPADGAEKPRRGRRGRKFVVNPRARDLAAA
ncbi:MAG TPA: YfjI family protein, partial [Phycisphaerae bacterium]|nr:YfjI family protein [Phycisphaerae bacterium]